MHDRSSSNVLPADRSDPGGQPAGRTTRLYRAISAALLCGCMVACGSGSRESASARCERVREHLIELELPPDDVTNTKREARAAVMRRAMGNEFLASCARSMSEKQTKCLLSAADSKSASACIAQIRR